MALVISHKDKPDHVVSMDAISDPDLVKISCTCGADLSHSRKKTAESALYTVDLIAEHIGGGQGLESEIVLTDDPER